MSVPGVTANAVERDRVTAIVVSNGRDSSYLPEVIRAVLGQSLPADSLLLVTTGDDPATSGAALEADDQAASFAFINVGERNNLGAAVQAGLARAREQQLDLPDGGWLWILHGDSAPAPTALDRLVRRGERSPRTGVVGPKQLAWGQEEQPILLEVGINATRSGRRVPEVELDERDQGQLDSRSDVLAVGTAGMLVRLDLWEKLGGLNPDLGPFGDGLEFSRRVRHADMRVVVEPTAIVYHAQQSLGADTADSFGARRRAQNINALLAASPTLLIFLWLGLVLVSPLRALWRLLTKDLARAKGELSAGWATLTSLGAVMRGRRRIADAGNRQTSLAELEARNRDVRAAKKESRRSRAEAEMLSTRPDPVTLKARADLRSHTIRGGVLALLAGVALALALHVGSLAAGVFDGGTLTQDTSLGTQLWARTWSGWLTSGDGSAYPVEPLWAVLIPILLIGQPAGLTLGALVSALLVASPILAALAAYAAAGQFTKSWVLRLTIALVWIAAPPFLEANSYGWFSIALLFVLVPVAVYALAGALRGSPHHLGLGALTFGLLAATAPIFLPLVLLVAIVGLAVSRGGRLRWLWLPVPAILVQLPNLLALRRGYLDFLLSVPGAPLGADANASTPAGLLDFFTTLDVSTTPDLTWLYLVPLVIFAAGALFALFRSRRRSWILAGWLVASGGLVLAAFSASRTAGSVASGTDVVPAAHLPALGLTLAWAGVTMVLVNGAYALRSTLRGRNFGVAHLTSVLLMVLIPLGALTLAGGWAYQQGWRNALDAATHPEPALAVTLADGPEKSRVLALSATDDGVATELWRGSGIELSEHSTPRHLNELVSDAEGDGADVAAQSLAQATANLTIAAADSAENLADHAVGIVLVRPTGETAYDRELSARLSSVPGLNFVAESEAGTFWRVEGVTTRAHLRGTEDEPLDSAEIRAQGRIEAAGEDRVVYLAERESANWTATLDGQALERADHDWATAWLLPAGAEGTLTIDHVDPQHRAAVAGAIAALIISAIIAVPVRLKRGRVE